VFDLYIMAIVFYVAIVMPFRIGFDTGNNLTFRVIDYVIDFSFLIDMLLTFFTSYYDE